jgi:hypothetical protein
MFLHSVVDLRKHGLLPQIAPKYVPNTIIMKQIDDASAMCQWEDEVQVDMLVERKCFQHENLNLMKC